MTSTGPWTGSSRSPRTNVTRSVDAVALRVPGGDGQGGGGDVGGDDPGVRELARQRDREAAAAGADVDDRAHAGAVPAALADGLDDELGLGARDEHVGGDVEVESPELAMAGDERDRLARGAPLDERREAHADVGRHRIAAVGDEPRAIPAERVPRQHFGVDPGVLGRQPGAHERLAGVSDAFVDGSQCSLRPSRSAVSSSAVGNCQCDVSDWKCVTA